MVYEKTTSFSLAFVDNTVGQIRHVKSISVAQLHFSTDMQLWRWMLSVGVIAETNRLRRIKGTLWSSIRQASNLCSKAQQMAHLHTWLCPRSQNICTTSIAQLVGSCGGSAGSVDGHVDSMRAVQRFGTWCGPDVSLILRQRCLN